MLDHAWDLLVSTIQSAINNDEEYFMRRIEYGQLLRIGLTHKRTLFDSNTPVMHSKHRGKGRERKNDEEKEKEKANLTTASSSSSSVLISDAFCYIDQFRNTNDVLSACILSSYIPGLFGPARAIFDRKNLVVRRACETLSELTHLGAVKFAYSDEPVEQQTSESPSSGDRNQSHEDESATDQFWDGGLSNVWPTLDDSTVIVSPISGIFEPNPSICPSLKGSDTVGDDMSKYTDTMKRIDAKFGESGGNGDDDDSKNSTRQFSWHGRMIYMDRQNAETVRRMTLSSDDDVLQARFQRGYNDARFVPSR